MTLNSVVCDSVSNVSRKGMQNPALVLHDEEGGSVLTELEDLSCVSEQNSYCSPTAINVENSKDVIVGPVTQFHGPLTIYHNGDCVFEESGATDKNKTITQNGKLVKSESTSSDSFPAVDKSTLNSLPCSRRLTYIGIAVVLTVVIVVALFAALLPANKTEEQLTTAVKYDKINNSKDDNEVLLEPVKNGSLISRAKWRAQTTYYNKSLKHPTYLVIMCHTASSPCGSFAQCAEKVWNIQSDQINRGFDDISYNFLIGGDGNAYVGRGWDKANVISTDSVSIAFIGNFVKSNLTESMVIMAKTLIENGVQNGKLSKDYKVVCHNQTAATVSPGRHVYEVVKTWSHFDPSSYLKSKS